MTSDKKDWLENMLRELAMREAQLAYALDFALDHVDTPVGSSPILGAVATLVKDADDAHSFDMFRTGLIGLIYNSNQEREAARIWHARRKGLDPDQDGIAIVDLAKEVARTGRLYRATTPLFPTGSAAIDEFRSDYLVRHFGQRLAGLASLEDWFARLGKPKSRNGLAISGVVANIVHEARFFGSRGDDRSKTLRRINRILRRLPNPLK
jgi:hypothetical protein